MCPTLRDRARITIPDVVFVLFTLGFFAALSPVFFEMLNQNLSGMGTGMALLLRLIPPLIIIVLLGVIYAKAVQGAR